MSGGSTTRRSEGPRRDGEEGNPRFILPGVEGLCNALGAEGTLSISDAFQHDSKQLHWDVATLGHTMLRGEKNRKEKRQGFVNKLS